MRRSAVFLTCLTVFQSIITCTSVVSGGHIDGHGTITVSLEKDVQELRNLLNVVSKQAKENKITCLTEIQSLETKLRQQAEDIKQSKTMYVAKISAMETELKNQSNDIKRAKEAEMIYVAKISEIENGLKNQTDDKTQAKQTGMVNETRLNSMEAKLRTAEITIQTMEAQINSLKKVIKLIQDKNNRSDIEQQDLKTRISHYVNASETQYKLFGAQLQNNDFKQQILENQLSLIGKDAGSTPVTKQIIWDTSDDKDEGVIKSITVPRTRNDSMIKVTYGGNLWTAYNGNRCSRWWFTFNGAECSVPATIDAVLHVYSTIHPYSTFRHTMVSGICYGIPSGSIRIDFHVGKCTGHDGPADAYTGYESVSRIIVEEI